MPDSRARAPSLPSPSPLPASVPTERRTAGGFRAGTASQRRGSPARRLLRVALCSVPWLLLGAASAGGSSTAGGSTSPLGGSGGGELGPLPAEPGETGVFVGMTAAHNAIRAELNVNPPLPDLTWSEDLAQFAQEWADNLANGANCGTIFHRDQRMYGENIAFRGSSRLTKEYAAEEAVQSWADEIECW